MNLTSNSGRLVAMAALVFLAACQTSGKDGVLSNALPTDGDPNQVASNDPNPGQNPNAKTRLKNTQTFRDIPKGKDKANDDNVRYQATITKVARECAYVGQNLEIKVGARGRVITGPSGQPGGLSMPIRVAVTEGGDTIYSKLHRPQASIATGSTSNLFSFVDDQVVIPAPRSRNVRVYIGFDEGPYNTP